MAVAGGGGGGGGGGGVRLPTILLRYSVVFHFIY